METVAFMNKKDGSFSMGVLETRFAEIIWERAPIRSGDLIGICLDEFGWNKSTTYTVLRRLTEKGIFKHEGGTVSAVLSRDEYMAKRSQDIVRSEFGGSLPALIAAFASARTLTPAEANSIKEMIDRYTENTEGEK